MKTRGRGRSGAVAFAALGVIILGVALWEIGQHPKKAVAAFPIRVAQTGDFFLYSGLYLALDSGAFKRNGLDVSITSTGGDEKSVAAVLSGNADIGIGDPTFAGLAKEKKQDIRAIASIVNGAPFWGITYSGEVAEKYRAHGLAGLTVATFPAPSTAYTLQEEMFKSSGLPVQIVQGAFGSLAGILERGEAEVALELEPNVSLLQAQKGALVLYSMAERHREFAITGATVKGDFIRSHGAQIFEFCEALNEGFQYARAHTKDAAILLSKRFPELPREVVTSALARMMSEGILPASSTMNPYGWHNAIALRAQVGDIKDVALAESALDLTACDHQH